MRLGIRLLFVFFLLNGMAAFFVLRVVTAEIKPSTREVMEDMMVDTANILAELAADDVAQGKVATGRFAEQVRSYAQRPIDAQIWGLSKQSLDYRVYVTDTMGRVLFDSENIAQGQDYSRWRDVALTLRGEYGARATREVQTDAATSVMYVAAPIFAADKAQKGKIVGVLTVAKPLSTVQDFIDRAERKVLINGLWLLAVSAAVGVAVTLWVVWNIRRLRRYAQSVQTGGNEAVPQAPGELGDLARAMQSMRQRLDGRDYIEAYVRALTHELKSPVAAIRASGELLEGDLPAAQRQQFAGQVVAQSERMQRLIDSLMALTKLEHQARTGQGLHNPQPVQLRACVDQALIALQASFAMKNIAACATYKTATGQNDGKNIFLGDAQAITLAVSNLLENALDFSPAHSTVTVTVDEAVHTITLQDQGPGVPDYALPRLGERFFTTVRPNGERSGSGLGLAIVRQVMALHGGSLRISNANGGLRAELLFAQSCAK